MGCRKFILLLAVSMVAGYEGPFFESTQENIGIFIPFDSLGLDTGATINSNKVSYRPSGAPDWNEAHPLLVIRTTKPALATSIFNLVPGASYEIRIDIQYDSYLTKQVLRTFQTESDLSPAAGRHLYVNPGTGSDLNDGLSPASAKASINSAVRIGLKPGDVVHLGSGNYFEEVVLDSIHGLPKNDIVFQGEGDSVFLEGYDSAFHPAAWESAGTDSSGNPVFCADWGAEPDGGYLSAPPGTGLDGMMYQYHQTNVRFGRALPDLFADLSTVNRLGAFYYDSTGRKVYLVLPPGIEPDSLRVLFSSRKSCVKARYSSRIVFRNLNIQHGGYYGLSLEGCNHIRVTGCAFRFHKSGICANAGILNLVDSMVCFYFGADSFCYMDTRYPPVADSQLTNHCVVESCLFTSPKAWEWNEAGTWGFMHDNEFGVARHHINGVDASYAGTGWIVRRCVFRDLFNGLYISQNGERGGLGDVRFFRNFDFHDNTMSCIADDCLEPEGAAINLRMYRNRMDRFRNGFSDSPTTVGPVFFMRNVMSNWIEGAIKAKEAWGSDVGVACHYHNTFFIGNDRYAQTKTVISAQCDLNDLYINNIYAGGNSVYGGSEGGGAPGSNLAMDYNSYYLSTGNNYLILSKTTCTTLERANVLGYEFHGLFNSDRRAPLFRNFDPDALDVSLRPGAIEIDRGVRIPGVNDNFKGLGPEIGAYEFDPDSIAAETGAEADREPLCTAVPNPFNGGVRLSFSVPKEAGLAALSIVDAAGRRVFHCPQVKPQGRLFRVVWNGTDNRGAPVTSGIYMVEWTCRSSRAVQKAVYIR